MDIRNDRRAIPYSVSGAYVVAFAYLRDPITMQIGRGRLGYGHEVPPRLDGLVGLQIAESR